MCPGEWRRGLVLSGQVNSEEWDLIGYLVSLGLSRKEAVDWAKARWRSVIQG